ncbi:MAG: caspase family protein [Crocinitomicaceae bacterium]|nr:caspase family protein [Crocinitomicaceae bacterium]
MIFLISEKAHGQALDLVVQRGHLFPVEKLCFHENNKFLASKDARQNIIIWDFMLGKEIVRFKDTSNVVAMDFLAFKDVLVTFNESGFIKYYDIESGDMLYRIPFNAEVKKIIHFNNNVLMMGDGLYLVDFESEEITKLTPHNFEDIKFSYSNYKFVGYTLNSEVIELDTLMEETKRGFLSSVDYSKLFQKNKQFSPADKVRADLVEMDAKNQTFFYLEDKFLKQTELFTGINKLKKNLHVEPNCMAVDDQGNYLVMGSKDGHTFLYNLKESYMMESKTHLGTVNDIEFSRDGRYFASVSDDYSVIVWSTIDGKLIHDLKSKALPVYGLDFKEESKTLFMAQDQGMVTVIDLKSKIDLPEKYHQTDHVGVVSDIKVAGSKYFTSGLDNTIVSYDIKTHQKLDETKLDKKNESVAETKSYGDEFIYSIQPSFDQSKLMVFYGTYKDDNIVQKLKVVSTADLNNVVKDQEVTSIEVPEEFMFPGSEYYYLPSFNYGSWGTKNYVGWISKKEFIVSSENTFALYEVKNGEVFEKEPMVQLLDEVTAVVKPNASQFFFSMGKALYSMKDYKEENVREINSHQDVITDLISSNDFLFTSSIDGTVKIWDKQIEELIATIVPFVDNSMLIFTPDKYYLSINGAHQHVGYKMGSEFVPFENYDLKYNRPDIVLKRLGLSEEATIHMLEKSYEKRLRKFGFTKDQITNTFYIPTVKIENKDAIPLISDKSNLDLDLKIEDENMNLDRLNVWVNGVPYFGMNGFDLKANKSKKASKKLNIGLSKGKNVIEVSAINVSGGESIKRKIEIFSNQDVGERSLYLITIGVQKFQDPSFNLNYSVKDATNIHDYFIGVNFDHSYDFKLLNEDFNLTKLEELKTVLKGSKPQDQVVLFIATHGLIDADFEYYFATSITNFNKPSEGGIHKSVLDNLLDSIPARNKLVLFDACHSGEIDKEDVVMAGQVEKDENVTFRAAGKTIKYGDINVQKVAELEELLFEDFRKGNGSTIMTSSSGVEFSMESEEWNNGLFTYALIDALRTSVNKEDVENLFENVFQKVQDLSKGNQTPTMRSFNKNATYFIK